ncbi:Pls/PosA family non-ribosomal peptide synthetase [Pseudonocardia sp. Cha107L01]|uniref:Pls/PosA family non-ribosomal peptide synthetase n=1 Tax=Pseudonocardia sp. Cha107L01 TaxID=3457576 RepID=UPI00403E69F5
MTAIEQRPVPASGEELVLVADGDAQGSRTRHGERLDHLFEERCDYIRRYGRGRHLAVDCDELVMTYGELDHSANQLARYLRMRGAKPGDRIALLFDEPAPSYLAMLAVLKISAAYVPLDVGFPADRLAYIVEDAHVKIVLSMSHVPGRVQGIDDITGNGAEMIFIDEMAPLVAEMDSRRLIDAERGFHIDQLAYIVYTSGSTGRPKGVAVDHPSICNFVRVAAQVYGIRWQDRVYQGLTIAFDFSFEEIWVPWICGATLVPKPPGASLLGAELHEFLTSRQVTAMCCVPTLLATIEEDLPQLRFLLVSGEACPQDLITRWHKPGRRFLNVYGPTEATVTATWTEVHPGKAVTIGVPLPTYSIVILDPEDLYRALPRGEVGEIGIAGIGLARGYLNRDDLTDRAFIPDFLDIPANPSGRIYRTGDLGRVNSDGEIEYLGRIDLQVKIRGYRIELTEIESVLLQVPGIAAAVVDTYSPDSETTELVGYYSLRTDTEHLDAEVIYARLRERLPSYMVPAYLEHLDAIPMTPQDKADRKNLPPPRQRTRTAHGAHVSPASDTERALALTLAQTLGVDDVSVVANFFEDFGANSLLMAQFSAQVRTLGILGRMSMRDIYLNPTIRQLAAALCDVDAVKTEASAAPTTSARRGNSAEYVWCGAMQLLLFLAAMYLGALLLDTGYGWISVAVGLANTCARAAMFSLETYLALCLLPIVAKWLLVGAWQPQEIRIWSSDYLRFWLVKVLIQTSPWALFAGSPLFVFYLRALGAKIGRGVTIHSRNIPVATDLITIGDGALIRKDCFYTGYRATSGAIQLGPVTLGCQAVVGEKTVLDIGTWMGDGAVLGHSSALQTGQAIPAGHTWHGCPAEPATTEYRTVPPARCSSLRKLAYSVLQLLGLLLPGTAVMALVGVAGPSIPMLNTLLNLDVTVPTSPNFYLFVLVATMLLFLGGLVIGLGFIMVVPRLLHLFMTPDKVYPLYGFHHLVQQAVTGITNSTFFMDLFGDTSAVVHYLRALGYGLSRVVQCGSNFGATLQHDSPYLTSVGTGTMISDSLSIMNADYSATSFRVSQVRIGERNFLGNNIALPSQARIGDNVLLASNVMIPIDGPIRENVGLLGSPPFEIPRSTEHDSDFDFLDAPDEIRRRLWAKNRHNTVTAILFLTVRWLQLFTATLIGALAAACEATYGALALAAAAVLMTVGNLLIGVLVERAAWGFRRLRPQFCSIYEPYFWRHERLWKLLATPPFNGTPFKNILWRLLGVRMGRRVFDDGCAIPEKTLVSIGDDAVLNAGSVIQCHSLEDGAFKSGYTTLGAATTLGIESFVHYGVTMGEGALLDAHAFLMKGEEVGPYESWQGNPANHVSTGPATHGKEITPGTYGNLELDVAAAGR